jgi:protein TonB
VARTAPPPDRVRPAARAAVSPPPPRLLPDTADPIPDWLAEPAPPPAAEMPAPVVRSEPVPGPTVLIPAAAAAPAALANYGREIAGAVAAHRRYPRLAQLREWQGTAVLQLELAADGQLTAVRVLISSGHEILDRQALDMVRAAVPLPPPPAGLSGRALAIDVPVVFRLAS